RLGEKKVSKMHRTLFVSLLLFVAVPLPGTGAWTGSLIALTLNLKLKKALPPIALGVLIAGIVVAIACFAGGGLADLFVSDKLINFFSK
ncbi:MAG: small multi-drug export protein, partial [Clostridia bacterium]|nr:small multi-drug export protein [Clostridia bacterium]